MSIEFSMLNILASEIKEVRTKLLEMTTKMELISNRIKKWESAEMLSITSEIDEKGKAAYSNAEKRQVELERRKLNDQVISGLEAEYEAIKKEYEELRIDLQYKYDLQENLRALARIGGGQL